MAGIKAEVSFRWRRWLAFGWILWNSVLTAYIVGSPQMDAKSLMWVAITLSVSNIFMALFYMAGASAVDIGHIVQGLAEFKTGRRRDDDDQWPTADDGRPI